MASSSHVVNTDQVKADAGIAEKIHPAHNCPLSLITVINKIWTCNGCKKSCKELEDTNCYHCSSCDFYLCQSCYQPKKYLVHEHDLTKTDVTSIYVRSKGVWQCDCCERNYGPNHL